MLELDSDDTEEGDQQGRSDETEEVEGSSLPPCVGLCHVERVSRHIVMTS